MTTDSAYLIRSIPDRLEGASRDAASDVCLWRIAKPQACQCPLPGKPQWTGGAYVAASGFLPAWQELPASNTADVSCAHLRQTAGLAVQPQAEGAAICVPWLLSQNVSSSSCDSLCRWLKASCLQSDPIRHDMSVGMTRSSSPGKYAGHEVGILRRHSPLNKTEPLLTSKHGAMVMDLWTCGASQQVPYVKRTLL